MFKIYSIPNQSLMRKIPQLRAAKITLKNTAAEAQSFAIFALGWKESVIKSTLASIAELIASTIRITNKTKAKNKCSKSESGKK